MKVSRSGVLGPLSELLEQGKVVFLPVRGLVSPIKAVQEEVIRLFSIRDYKKKWIKFSWRPCSYRSINLKLH